VLVKVIILLCGAR